MFAPGVLVKKRNPLQAIWTHSDYVPPGTYTFQVDISVTDPRLQPVPRGYVYWYRDGVYQAFDYATPASVTSTITTVTRDFIFDVNVSDFFIIEARFNGSMENSILAPSEEWDLSNFSTTIHILV